MRSIYLTHTRVCIHICVCMCIYACIYMKLYTQDYTRCISQSHRQASVCIFVSLSVSIRSAAIGRYFSEICTIYYALYLSNTHIRACKHICVHYICICVCLKIVFLKVEHLYSVQTLFYLTNSHTYVQMYIYIYTCV